MAERWPASPAGRESRASKSRPASMRIPRVEKKPGLTPLRLTLFGYDAAIGLDGYGIVPASAGQERQAGSGGVACDGEGADLS